MKTKNILFIGIFIILISLTFIFAVHSITPASFTVNEDTYYVYSIVINNTDTATTGNITQVNITLPEGFVFVDGSNASSAGSAFVNTGTVLSWSNLTGILINGGGVNQSFEFNATMATAGNYNFTVTRLNSSGAYSTNVPVTINDTTYPTVTINTPVTGANISGSYVLNATIIEDTASLVYFNITNSSGGQNGTFTASHASGSSSWNATINTSTYEEGYYNVSVWVNDSNNQINNTVFTYSILIDNTAPIITQFSCNPSSVYTTNTVTCSCINSDSGSGISLTSFTQNPSTSTTGTFTETCTVTDRAGNTRRSSFSSGSSTTKTWKNTYTASEDILETGYTKTIEANERIKVRVINEDHYVGVKSVSSNSAVIEIASNPIEITLDIGEDAKADVNEDGIYDIHVVLNNIIDGKADITIKKISQEILEGEEAITTTGEITTEETQEEPEKSNAWIWIIIILALIIIGSRYKIKKK